MLCDYGIQIGLKNLIGKIVGGDKWSNAGRLMVWKKHVVVSYPSVRCFRKFKVRILCMCSFLGEDSHFHMHESSVNQLVVWLASL